jgi:hypothetical protein
LATAKRSAAASRCSIGASSSATNEIAERPSTAPVGETRKTRRPAPAPDMSPTAPVSQNSIFRLAAASAAGAEIVLP